MSLNYQFVHCDMNEVLITYKYKHYKMFNQETDALSDILGHLYI